MGVGTAALPSLRALEYWIRQSRRTWTSGLTVMLVNPVLFLGAMGLGLGSLVDDSPAGGVDGVSYLDFLAPGLLAAAAIQTAMATASFPVTSAIKWVRTYHAMLATPLGALDVLVGHALWVLLQIGVGSGLYLIVMVLFGAVASPLAVLALPVALLTGAAFALPLMALAARIDNEIAFPTILRFCVVPMFLFSGVFYPVSTLPAGLEQVAYLTPLWHGVDLCRSLCLGAAGVGGPAVSVLHVVYLGGLAALGALLARRSYVRRLVV